MNGSLSGADVRNGPLGLADLSRGLRNRLRALGGVGPAGPSGPPGPAGPSGAPGPASLRALPVSLVGGGAPVDVPGFGLMSLSCSGPEATVAWTNTSGEAETIGGPKDIEPLVVVAAGQQVFLEDLDLDGAADFGYVLMSVRRASGPVASIVGWAEICVIQAQAILT